MIQVVAKRDGDHFLVKKDDGAYLLVDLLKGHAIESRPPDNPDIFVKSGYWQDAGEIDSKTQAEIDDAMKNVRQLPEDK